MPQTSEPLFFDIPWSNPLASVLLIAIALGGTIIIKMALKFIENRFKKISDRFEGVYDDILIECLHHTKGWAVFIWILQPLVQNNVPATAAGVKSFVFGSFVVLSAVQVAIWGLRTIGIWRDNVLKKKVAQDKGSVSAIGLLSTGIQGLFVIALVMVCLSNLGVDIAALIAGLGVGGIAVALAAQNILGDLFGSLSIVLDKPFVVGDFIVVGQEMGTVENIGIKTTRVRSLSGEELIFANKDLLESRIKNFKRMYKRRAVLKFGVAYGTPVEKLAAIPVWVKEFIENEETLSYERCHLMEYSESALTFETVFWVDQPDQGVYMDHQQAVMLKIIDRFYAEDILFALPTRNLLVRNIEENVGEDQDFRASQQPRARGFVPPPV